MKKIVLLHGALGSTDDLLPLQQQLEADFEVHTLNFYGHAGDLSENEFSIEHFAAQVLEWMDQQAIETISVFGYSLGGYVALYMACNHAGRIERVITLGTKLYWDPSVAEKEIAKIDPVHLQEKYPAFTQRLEQKHTPANWKKIAAKTAGLLQHIGRFNPLRFEDFNRIKPKVLLVLGDRDTLVSFVETTTVYRELPDGQFAVLPNTPHVFADVNINLLQSIIRLFLA